MFIIFCHHVQSAFIQICTVYKLCYRDCFIQLQSDSYVLFCDVISFCSSCVWYTYPRIVLLLGSQTMEPKISFDTFLITSSNVTTGIPASRSPSAYATKVTWFFVSNDPFFDGCHFMLFSCFCYYFSSRYNICIQATSSTSLFVASSQYPFPMHHS